MAWCHFLGEGEALCLLQAGALSAYTLAGELQGVPLPPGFTAMWALPQGLLLAVRAQDPCIKGPAGMLAFGRGRRTCCWQRGLHRSHAHTAAPSSPGTAAGSRTGGLRPTGRHNISGLA